MNSKIDDDERANFSDRLKGALTAAGFDTSPTRFIAEFNVRADGAAVTVHGARKWLVGDAIPTQVRIQILADWLGISAAWLRFGDAGNSDCHTAAGVLLNLQSSELVLLHDFRLLTEGNRQLMRSIVDTMLHQQYKGHPTVHSPRTSTV